MGKNYTYYSVEANSGQNNDIQITDFVFWRMQIKYSCYEIKKLVVFVVVTAVVGTYVWLQQR